MTKEKIILQLWSLVEEAETHIEPDCEQVWLDDKEALLEAINLIEESARIKEELANIKGVAKFQQKSNMERGFRIKELEEELRVYKKALGYACNHIHWMCEEKTCNTCRFANKCLNDNTNSWEDTFLQEAGMPKE